MNHFVAELEPQYGASKPRYGKKKRSHRYPMHFNANRAWLEVGEDRDVIFLAATNLERLKEYLPSCKMNFLTYHAKKISLILLLSDKSHENRTFEFASMFPWIKGWDSEKNLTFCQRMTLLNEGNDVLFVPNEGNILS